MSIYKYSVIGQSVGIRRDYLLGMQKIGWNLGEKNKRVELYCLKENRKWRMEFSLGFAHHSGSFPSLNAHPQSDFPIYLTKPLLLIN